LTLPEVEPDLTVAREAGDGGQAVDQARVLDPDVILMEVRMPQMNGIEAAARLVQSGSHARVLRLTTFNLDEYIYHALKAGASGFLLKDASRGSSLMPYARWPSGKPSSPRRHPAAER
jgi:DNA-binding NarL/FixJ family response regulator